MIQEHDVDEDQQLNFEEWFAKWQAYDSDSESEISLEEMFSDFDKDGNGFITFAEYEHVISIFGGKVTNEKMRAADIDGDGQWNFEEFVADYEDYKDDETSDEEIFNDIDKDGNGYISSVELMTNLGQTEEEADEMIRVADIDGDGQVDYIEFIAA